MNRKHFCIIGGDERMVNLAKLLAKDNFFIDIYAMEKINFENTNIKIYDNLETCIKNSEFVVSSIPLSKDGKVIFTPYSNIELTVEKFADKIKSKSLIAGKIPDNLSSIKKYDITEDEEFSVFNAIATAEGTIKIAMEEYPETLNGSKVLILGFGRIGKFLAKMFNGIGSQVYCEARKKEDLAYISGYGYVPVDLENIDNYLKSADIIINTIPFMILNQEKLNLVKNDVLIIDLASKPGGVDFEYAKKNNIKTNWALGLPGKVAPISAAKYIQNFIYKIIEDK